MSGCAHCSGSCGGCSGCSGCGGQLELTRGEIGMLLKLGQIPFLPVARKMGDENPVYLEDAEHTVEEYGLILLCLETRGLISLDYDKPLKSFDDGAYAAYPIRGSMALTERGQKTLELLEYQGFQTE